MHDSPKPTFSPLSDYLISDAPPSMYYIRDFISAAEEEEILSKIPSNRWISLSHRRLQAWPSQLTKQNALLVSSKPKQPTANSSSSSSSELPTWLGNPILPRLYNLAANHPPSTNGANNQAKPNDAASQSETADESSSIFAGAPHGINHCLINEYEPGQGIFPHEDGGAYFHAVATVSLGSTIVLDVSEKKSAHENGVGGEQSKETREKGWRILQEPRSLLITTGEAYTGVLHGIAEVTTDEGLDGSMALRESAWEEQKGGKKVANWDLLSEETRREIQENGGDLERKETRVSLTFRDVLKVVDVAGKKIFGIGGIGR